MAKQVAWELVDSERIFVRDLAVLQRVFVAPLADRRDLLSEKEHGEIFCNVESLYSIHVGLLKKLSPQNSGRSLDELVSDIIAAFSDVGALVAAHEVYCCNYSVAMDRLDELMKSRKALADFIHRCEDSKDLRFLELRDFLIKPVQRVCKYPLLFRELARHYEGDEALRVPVSALVDRLEKVAAHINLSRRDADNLKELLAVEARLEGRGIRIAVPNRRLIREGTLLKQNSRGEWQERTFILFSDLLVYAKDRVTKTECRMLQYRDAVPLAHTVVRRGSEEEDEFDRLLELVRVDTKRTYVLCAKTRSERDSWVAALSDVVAELVSRRRGMSITADWTSSSPNVAAEKRGSAEELTLLRRTVDQQAHTIERLQMQKAELLSELEVNHAALRSTRRELAMLRAGRSTPGSPAAGRTGSGALLGRRSGGRSTREAITRASMVSDGAPRPPSQLGLVRAVDPADWDCPLDDESAPASANLTIKHGFLWKTGVSHKGWKRRWFVLRDHSLAYYASPKDGRAKGQIPLRHLRVLDAGDPRRPNSFTVATGGRDYAIAASSPAERLDWIEAIRRAVLSENENVPRAQQVAAAASLEGVVRVDTGSGDAPMWALLVAPLIYIFQDRSDLSPAYEIPLDGCRVDEEPSSSRPALRLCHHHGRSTLLAFSDASALEKWRVNLLSICADLSSSSAPPAPPPPDLETPIPITPVRFDLDVNDEIKEIEREIQNEIDKDIQRDAAKNVHTIEKDDEQSVEKDSEVSEPVENDGDAAYMLAQQELNDLSNFLLEIYGNN